MLIIPLVLLGLIFVHLGLLVRQKHTQFAGEGRTEHNVVGSPMFPTFMAKTTGFLFMVTAATALLGAFVQIDPIWQFGSYDASKISYAVQPDWYMGWLDGALRIMPSWEFAGWARPYPFEVLLPAVVFRASSSPSPCCGPALERKVTGDDELHNLLDRPRDRPKRTATGAAMFALLFTLFGASSTDVLADFFHISLERGPVVLPDRCVRDPGHCRVGRPTSCAGRCRACTGSGSASGPSSCSGSPTASTAPCRRRHDPTTCTRSSIPSPCRCASTSNHWTTAARVSRRAHPRCAPGHTLTERSSRATAHDLWVALETVHAVTYFAPGPRRAA